ncbi:MAG: hypothetical protein WD098_04855 [Balneolales bacterium]
MAPAAADPLHGFATFGALIVPLNPKQLFYKQGKHGWRFVNEVILS